MTGDIRRDAAERRPWEARRVRIEGVRKQALETGRNRVVVTAAVFALAFAAISTRLVGLTVLDSAQEPKVAQHSEVRTWAAERADIRDRNGVVLATSLPTVSLYADPAEVLDPVAAADRLQTVLPDLDRQEVVEKLSGPGRFIWVRRNLTPTEQYDVNRLGIPGLQFQRSDKRVYPHGRMAAHVLGLTDLDGRGIAGVEREFDGQLREPGQGLDLSIDVRLQAIVREEVQAAVREFTALGGAGLVLDAKTGETLAMVSLPDFDPNQPETLQGEAGFNRATKGVYEMGSIFKLFTAAMALDAGTVTIDGGYDASKPIHVARFTIHDFHPENRWLSVPEILIHSSNIGAAKMALDVGTKTQQRYLRTFGLLDAPSLELPEIGRPLLPAQWREINTMTISYGHGIAVTPLQVVTAVAGLANGGIRYTPTLLKREPGMAIEGEKIVSRTTSREMRGLMEMVVKYGSGKNAQVKGYRIGGKTGTAEKEINGRYARKKQISSFVGAFPMEDPRYVVLVMVDEPHGTKKTFGYATGGWVGAPAVGRIVKRMAPLMGVEPTVIETDEPKPKEKEPSKGTLLVALRAAIDDAREAQGASR